MTADPDTMKAFADAAVAFMNDGINRLPLDKQAQIKAHTDAGATVACVARFPMGYFSIVITPKGSTEAIEIVGGYLTMKPDMSRPN